MPPCILGCYKFCVTAKIYRILAFVITLLSKCVYRAWSMLLCNAKTNLGSPDCKSGVFFITKPFCHLAILANIVYGTTLLCHIDIQANIVYGITLLCHLDILVNIVYGTTLLCHLDILADIIYGHQSMYWSSRW